MMVVETTVKRERTAMSRAFLSRPVTQALQDGVIGEGSTVFDYGCGRGGDIKRLRQLGYTANGWDPNHQPDNLRRPADVVNIGYVVNVIEDPHERADALREAWGLANEALVISARLDWEQRGTSTSVYSDGVLTGADTFQKYFSQEELRAWIDGTLNTRSVAAAPGVFYAFRRQDAAQRLLANQTRGQPRRQGIAELIYQQHTEALRPLEAFVEEHGKLPGPAELPDSQQLIEEFGSLRAAFSLIRRVTGSGRWQGVDLGRSRTSERRFEQNLPILQPLIDFLTERGRLPRPDELAGSQQLIEEFGSVRAAFSLIRRVTPPGLWAASEQTARDNTLVYLAVAALAGRPRLRELPHDLQYDIKDFHGTYKNACAQADELLYTLADQDKLNHACAQAPLGKLTREALYLHRDGTHHLPPLLRVYEGCARALTGTVSQANILKLNRHKPQVTYLAYPEFDSDPHPALTAAVTSHIPQLRVSYRNYLNSTNPPILHRKETLVPGDYPGRQKFARLTKQEEHHGLLNPDTPIGNRNDWNTLLTKHSLKTRGHQLTRA